MLFMFPKQVQDKASRRAVALFPVILLPDGAQARDDADAPARRGRRARAMRSRDDVLQSMPEEVETSKAEIEDWEPYTIGESSLVDPNDPKYKQLRLLADIERQQRKNEEYNSMSQEEKQAKMCELLGRGCQ